MMFSQGCAVVLSLWLYHQSVSPDTPFPFKMAIFICGSAPVSAIPDLRIGIPDLSKPYNLPPCPQSTSPSATFTIGSDQWISSRPNQTGNIDLGQTDPIPDLNCGQIPAKFILSIPTVHIYGSRDPVCPTSIQLAQLCESKFRKLYDHEGGHEIPRRSDISRAIAELIEWCVSLTYH